jgi:uncharacterized protein with HEPN domain
VFGKLMMLSEAATRLSGEYKDSRSSIEWHLISGLRNIIVYEYFRVSWPIVWEIISHDLPVLEKAIKKSL